MQQILFASSNANKIQEIKALLPQGIELLSLSDIGYNEEIPENELTIEGNAIAKACYLSNRLNIPCFADDTGLCIPALNGEPGVFSARYAGPQKNSSDNIQKVLEKLGENSNRDAYFETVIALHDGKQTWVFSGRVNGTITKQVKGDFGFGYDPIFTPNGYNKTFAELSFEEKNKISHRRLALDKMLEHFTTREKKSNSTH
jgi:XTP/dITP diphosphohydrolase